MRPAVTVEDFEGMRLVRNACRMFMTNDQNEIDSEAQVAWRESVQADHSIEPWVLVNEVNVVIGYGIVRFDGEASWLSGGVSPDHRGLGFGRKIFSTLADWAAQQEGAPVMLEVFDNNRKARQLYESLGFVYKAAFSRRDECVHVMRLNEK